MYILYRQINNIPTFIGYTLTKKGARKAKKHFVRKYCEKNNGAYVKVTYEKTNSYIAFKAALKILDVSAARRARKLREVQYKQRALDRVAAGRQKKYDELDFVR